MSINVRGTKHFS